MLIGGDLVLGSVLLVGKDSALEEAFLVVRWGVGGIVGRSIAAGGCIGTRQCILNPLAEFFQAPFKLRASVEERARHTLRAKHRRLRPSYRSSCCVETPSTILVSLQGIDPRGNHGFKIRKFEWLR